MHKPIHAAPSLLLLALLRPLAFAAAAPAAPPRAQTAAAAPKGAKPHDTLIFLNGDTLTGKLDREVAGEVYFKSDELGELKIAWNRIRSLQTAASYAVLEQQPKIKPRHFVAQAVQGRVSVHGDQLTIEPVPPTKPTADAHASTAASAAAAPQTQNATKAVTNSAVTLTTPPAPYPVTIPVNDARYILDNSTFEGQVRHAPNALQGWRGSLTGGVTLVRATQNQTTYTSAFAVERTVPTVDWLPTRNRSSLDFSSDYGLITQPAYQSAGVLVPATSTKSAIFHADAERDQYISPRVFLLTQTAFDHNYAQGLDLQQIYGAGAGLTLLKGSRHELDLKAALQYEKQAFITSASGTNQNLVGSTLSGNYKLKLPGGIIITQLAEYLPAFNVLRAYSANETNTVQVPFYKELAFTLGTIDSYLNDPVVADPPTRRNSFQFTTGVTYTIKSKY